MPWLETVPMDQRTQFIADHQRGLYPVTELCAHYGISRKTGYKWLARFDAGGRQALADRSRAPITARTASRRTSPTCSAPPGDGTRTGERASCSTTWRPAILTCPGPPSAP